MRLQGNNNLQTFYKWISLYIGACIYIIIYVGKIKMCSFIIFVTQ